MPGLEPPAPGATRFCIVRHGETTWNAERRIQGHIDVALSAVGVRQAAAAARAIAVAAPSALYSSDLGRARQTAEAIGRRCALSVRLAPELRERRYGVFEGLTYGEAQARHPEAYAAFAARRPEVPLPGGESLEDFRARVVTRLAALAAAHPGETVVVVTHGGVLDLINRFVRGLPLSTPRDFEIPNTALNWVLHGVDGWHLERWADTAHLGAALDELDLA